MKLILSFLFLVISFIIFYFMYPSIKNFKDISSKIENANGNDNFKLKIQRTNIITKLIIFGSCIMACLVVSISLTMSHYDFKINSTC